MATVVSAVVEGSEQILKCLSSDTTSLNCDGVWESDGNQFFDFTWTETETAYGETETSSSTASTKIPLNKDLKSNFTSTVTLKPCEAWGINFAGSIEIQFDSSNEKFTVYLPGTRTYDPAGMSGDPHASERIGGSCSKAQLLITTAQLTALKLGADSIGLQALQDVCRPNIDRYHGRAGLFDYMFQQLSDVCIHRRSPPSYPEFLKSKPEHTTGEVHAHTRAYLESFDAGNPRPPYQYFAKQAAKEDMEKVFNNASKYEDFKQLTTPTPTTQPTILPPLLVVVCAIALGVLIGTRYRSFETLF